MRLSRRDAEAFQGATLALHEERDLEAFREAVPTILLGLVSGEYFVWLEFGYGSVLDVMHNLVLWDTPSRLGQQRLRRMMELIREHPFTPHFTKGGDPGPMRLSDFWSDRQLVASPIYRDVYRPCRVGQLLAIASARGNRFGSLNLSRPLSAPDFTERDRFMLKLVHPHFLLAMQAAERASARTQSHGDMLRRIGLTPREVEVALWLARGRTNPEIASILATRPRTIEKHVEKILEKLGVENRTAAATVIAGTTSLGGTAEETPEG